MFEANSTAEITVENVFNSFSERLFSVMVEKSVPVPNLEVFFLPRFVLVPGDQQYGRPTRHTHRPPIFCKNPENGENVIFSEKTFLISFFIFVKFRRCLIFCKKFHSQRVANNYQIYYLLIRILKHRA